GGDDSHIVANKQNSAALTARDLVHLAEALLLKISVAHREHLIHDEDLWLQMRSDRKRKANIHSRRVTLYRGFQKPLYFRKRNNFIEFLPNFGTSHAKNRTVQVDVLPARQFGVKSGANFLNTSHH